MNTSSHIAMTLHRSRKNEQNDDHVNVSTTTTMPTRPRRMPDKDSPERERHPLETREHPCHERDNQNAQQLGEQVATVGQ